MARRIILHFISSCLAAFLLGLILWIIREMIATFDLIWRYKISTFILDYDHFMIFFIILLCLPVGSILGILVVDKWIFKLPALSVKGMVLGFIFSFLGMGAMIIMRIFVEGNSDMIPAALDYIIGTDRLIFVMPVIAGFLSSLGYNIGK